MKSINKFLLFAFLCLIALSSCDVIDEPYKEKGNTTITDTADIRKMFLEDYTGYRCTNCPEAAAKVHQLKETYSDNLVVVAVHSGYFAETKPNSIFDYDFTINEGEDWDTFFKISDNGNPLGMINRMGYNQSQYIFGPDSWSETLFGIKDNKADMNIDLTATYSSADKKITANVNITYIKPGKANHKVVVLAVEDSIVDAQIDVGVEKTDYVHNHVLRAVFNGAWGTQLSDVAIDAGFKTNKSFQFVIPTDTKHPWRSEKIKIIAFVHDDGESYEVLQAEEVNLIAK